MKHMTPVQKDERLNTLQEWEKTLLRVATDMRANDNDVLADHLDSIMDDLDAQRIMMLENGPIFERKS